MAFVKLASLLFSLLLVFHALRDSSAHVVPDKYAPKASVAVHQHQDQNKDLEAAKQEVTEEPKEQRLYPEEFHTQRSRGPGEGEVP